MALHITRNHLAIELIVLNGMGPGTNQAHVPFQDIEQLRQFIEAPAPQKTSNWSNAWIISGGLLHHRLIRRIKLTHAAELQAFEALAIQAITILLVKNRP